MEIRECKKDKIEKAFKKFIDICKNPQEFERRVDVLKQGKSGNSFLEYVGPLLILGEFYERIPKEDNCDEIIYEYMMKIKEGVEGELPNISLSLFNGLSDIGYSVYSVCRKTGYYEKFLKTLNGYIVSELENIVALAENNIGNMSALDYDTIYGLAGIGGYLLMFKEEEEVSESLKSILKVFVKMCEYIQVRGHMVPGWYIPPEKLFDDRHRKRYPKGNFNEALSHGICGPLVFMSLALNENIQIKGQREAIENIINELLRFHYKDEYGRVYWSGVVRFDDYIRGKENELNSNRQSWCYGTIGIARSLYIAGNSIKNEEIKSFASDILLNLANTDPKSWLLQCSHICHGYAGALGIMEIMNKEDSNKQYEKCIDILTDIIIESFDEKSLFGFYNYTIKGGQDLNSDKSEFEYKDDHTFLEGSLGTVLALMNYLDPKKDYWMRHIMIK